MPLHLLKLCVGVATIDDLEAHVEERLRSRRADEPAHAVHTMRMVPARATEILDGGSLYWVIRGHVAARQLVRGIDPFTDAEGVRRCRLALEADVVPVMPRFFVSSIAQSGGHPRRDVSGVVAPRTPHLDPAIRPIRQAMGRRMHCKNIRGIERRVEGNDLVLIQESATRHSCPGCVRSPSTTGRPHRPQRTPDPTHHVAPRRFLLDL